MYLCLMKKNIELKCADKANVNFTQLESSLGLDFDSKLSLLA